MPLLAGIVGRFRSNRQTIFAWPEAEIALGPRVAIFVHFDAAGQVREYVLHYLRALRAAGFDVVFVTNSGFLTKPSLAAVQLICNGVLIRRNVGYDFGAWRDALEGLGLPRDDTRVVILANDSLYGPLAPLGTLLNRIDLEAAPLWGLTDTWQTRYHLQSYFLVVSAALMRTRAWSQFWKRVRPVPSKLYVINMYEIGLTQAALKAGHAVRAVWPYRELTANLGSTLVEIETQLETDERAAKDPLRQLRREHIIRIRSATISREPVNPTVELWRQLLIAGFPFIKRELLRDNPTSVVDLVDWRDVIRQVFDSDGAMIERDLQRTLRGQSP